MAGEAWFDVSDEPHEEDAEEHDLDGGTAAARRSVKVRKRGGPIFRKKKRVRTELLSAEPAFGRDTGYCCDVCACVFWDSTVSNRPVAWRNCPVCGEQLARGSQVCFSKTAVSAEKDVLNKMRSIASARPKAIVVEIDAEDESLNGDEMLLVPNGRAKSKTCLSTSNTKRLKRAREAADHSHDGGEELQVVQHQKPLPVRRQDKFRFCDVCGHGSTEVNCSTCSSSFHKRCLNRPPNYPFPKRWTCHSCVHHDLQRHGRIPDAKDFEERGLWKPPDAPTQCSSCGYLEIESVNCDLCERWFCFACMCLSVATVPRTAWFCPECVGQDRYDAMNRESIERSREKLAVGDGTAKERDGFSQLVFDLSCGCNWDEWERNIHTLLDITRKQLEARVIPVMVPFHSLHYARPGVPMDNTTIRAISIAYAKDTKERAMRSVQSRDGQYKAWKPEHVERVSSPPRLRIGYISSDFVNHPTADLIQSALLLHDARRFEVFCYSITKDDRSAHRRTLMRGMEHFRNLPRKHSDKHCADLIAEDGIHILVNLNGHTAGDRNGISALRPAPVQLVYLAYPGTMGADYVDWNVADHTVCPPEHRDFYVERLLHLPFCYQTNSFQRLYGDILDKALLPKRKDHQLPERPTLVFCNFCRLGRITPELFDVWVRILRRVPNSVIWLYKHPKAAVLRLKSQAVRAGLSEHRLVFSPPCSPKLEHLKRVTLADLCLDTLVYNGHTTACDMLWAGVPYVTMSGQNWPSLVATALAHTVEMPEMVVKSLAQYEELAVKLATKPSLLRKWKRKLAHKRLTAPLFDSERWVRSFEDGLETVWRLYQQRAEDPRDVVCRDFGPSPNFQRLMAQHHSKRLADEEPLLDRPAETGPIPEADEPLAALPGHERPCDGGDEVAEEVQGDEEGAGKQKSPHEGCARASEGSSGQEGDAGSERNADGEHGVEEECDDAAEEEADGEDALEETQYEVELELEEEGGSDDAEQEYETVQAEDGAGEPGGAAQAADNSESSRTGSPESGAKEEQAEQQGQQAVQQGQQVQQEGQEQEKQEGQEQEQEGQEQEKQEERPAQCTPDPAAQVDSPQSSAQLHLQATMASLTDTTNQDANTEARSASPGQNPSTPAAPAAEEPAVASDASPDRALAAAAAGKKEGEQSITEEEEASKESVDEALHRIWPSNRKQFELAPARPASTARRKAETAVRCVRGVGPAGEPAGLTIQKAMKVFTRDVVAGSFLSVLVNDQRPGGGGRRAASAEGSGPTPSAQVQKVVEQMTSWTEPVRKHILASSRPGDFPGLDIPPLPTAPRANRPVLHLGGPCPPAYPDSAAVPPHSPGISAPSSISRYAKGPTPAEWNARQQERAAGRAAAPAGVLLQARVATDVAPGSEEAAAAKCARAAWTFDVAVSPVVEGVVEGHGAIVKGQRNAQRGASSHTGPGATLAAAVVSAGGARASPPAEASAPDAAPPAGSDALRGKAES